jgi:hypothetical protein
VAKTQDDKQQIGLTPETDASIKDLATTYFGGSQQDAYRFAIAYAIAVALDPAEAPQSGYTTKYNALGGVESGSSIRDLLEILGVGELERPWSTAEKLAELGTRDLSRRLQGNESLADILTELATP